MEYNIDEVKIKPAKWLDDGEKDFLRQNVDKLNDEDKAAYADFLTPDDDTAGTGDQNAAAGSSDDGNNNGGQGDQANANAAGDDQSGKDAGAGANANPVNPDTGYQFKNEAEARAFVERTLQEKEAEKQKALDAAKTPEERRFVEDNFKPDNWNEGFKLAVKFAKEEIRAENAAEEKKVADNRKRLQTEWEDVAKVNSLPSLDTQEGRVVHDQILKIAIAHGKTNFKDAHELWSMIPAEKGGGYKVDASTAGAALADAKKAQMSDQKKVAAKVGGQQPAGTQKSAAGSLDVPDYKTLHEARSVKDLMKKTGVLHG